MTKSAFGFAKSEDSPGFMLWQTTITWQRLIKKALDPYHISHAQFVILAITLWHEHENTIPQSLLIRQSKLDKMTVSKSLKKLATAGYLNRQEHTVDTRAKSVYLTKKGKELISKLIPIIENIDAVFFSAIKKSERTSLLNHLNDLVCNNEIK